MLVACLAGSRGPERELTKAVQCFGLAERLPEIAEQFQGLLMAGSGGRIVPGQLLHHAEVVESPGLVGPIAQVAEDLQGLTDLGAGGRVVAGPREQFAEESECFGLAEPVTQAAVQVQRAGQIQRGGQIVADLELRSTDRKITDRNWARGSGPGPGAVIGPGQSGMGVTRRW